MIKIICNGPLAYNWMRHIGLFHPSIDYLQRISEKLYDAGMNENHKLCCEFSSILSDIVIDGAWKKTSYSRLAISNQNLLEVLRSDRVEDIRVLDVGCSDGITTLNLMEYLQRELDARVKATLLDKNMFILRRRRIGTVVYSTSYGKPFFIRMGRIGIKLERLRGKYGIIFNPIIEYLVSLIRKHAHFFSDSNKKRISIISPALEGIQGLTYIEADVFCKEESLLNSFEIVRASNILNREYFSDAQILVAIHNLKQYLKESGLLLISLNIGVGDTEVEVGTIWKMTNGKLVKTRDFGGGSELKAIIESHDL
jgi:chemotaxis methyl-accepting protein methylase